MGRSGGKRFEDPTKMKWTYTAIIRNFLERNIAGIVLHNIVLCPFDGSKMVSFQARANACIRNILRYTTEHLFNHFNDEVIHLQFSRSAAEHKFHNIEM